MDRRHLITTGELSRAEIEAILARATEIDEGADADISDFLLGLLFFEPSTRTRLSFEAAAKRLGGDVVDLGAVEASSVEKGETLADSVRVLEGYCDAMVLRHPREGAARMATEFVNIPLINGGDGAGHHPSQTLLDLYTIQKHHGLDGLTIGILGDLKYGRTVHSLATALTKFDADQHFISPESLRLPRDIRFDLHEGGATVREHTSMEAILPLLDVLYVTRIQRERFPDENEYRSVAGQYRIDEAVLADASDDLIILHPLPRVDEIDPAIDETDRAKYFEQSHNGVPVRMALLELLMEGSR